MAKKYEPPAVTIGRYCPICGKHFVLAHPKDTKPFCDECIAALREVIQEKIQGGQNITITVR